MFKGPVAVFWLDRVSTNDDLPALLERAKAADIMATESEEECLSCKWAGMSAWGWTSTVDAHRLLWIQVPRGDFFELVKPSHDDLPLTHDEALPIAQTFGESATALAANVGILAIREHQKDRARIHEFESYLLAYDTDDLLDERFGLLYISDEYLPYWTHTPIRDDRDELPVARGRLLFAGRGGSRWF